MKKDEKTIEQEKRAKLKAEKPAVYKKIIQIKDRYEQGIPTPIFDIAYNYACNLKCAHCSASRFKSNGYSLDVKSLRNFSDQCDALGLCQFNLSGGEPLILKNIDEVLAALQPDKFHLSMSTNGYFLDADMAKRLKANGLDKVKISMDSFNEKEHDANRNSPGAYQKALAAMRNAQAAGISVVVQTVVTRQNCQSGQLEEMAKFATANGYSLDVMVARAIGAWEGRHDVLVNESDCQYMWDLHQKYPVLHRDTFPSYGMDKGCGCVNATLHLTQYGDVLPCVFIHISIGNIFEESLADIIKRGQSIRCFREHSKLCLSGEDRNFINKYMSKFYGKPLPVHWSEVFSEEDFIK